MNKNKQHSQAQHGQTRKKKKKPPTTIYKIPQKNYFMDFHMA